MLANTHSQPRIPNPDISMLDSNIQNDIVAHMNADHADAVLQYALAFTAGQAVSSAQIVSIDATSVVLACAVGSNGHTETDRSEPQQAVEHRRIVFADTGAGTRIDSAKDARMLLIKMAKLAREKLAHQA